jgi:hypothetical protein
MELRYHVARAAADQRSSWSLPDWLAVTQEAAMATYRIVCTLKEPSGHSNPKEHIVAVGVGDDAHAHTVSRWTLAQVLAAIDLADIFYTRGTTSDTVALVEKYTCTQCRRGYIRSAPDAVTDNHLDSLRSCS